MVLPRWLARTNRRFTNRILGRIPARFSPFVMANHVGRSTGTHYRVPLAGFSTRDGYLLTPTYGPEADWVLNIIAAGSFTLQHRGQAYALNNARLVDRSEAWPNLPVLVRVAMRILRIRWFVLADRT